MNPNLNNKFTIKCKGNTTSRCSRQHSITDSSNQTLSQKYISHTLTIPQVNHRNKNTESLYESAAYNHEILSNCTDDLLWSVSIGYQLLAANKAFIDTLEDLMSVRLKPGDMLLREDIYTEKILASWKSCFKKALSGKAFSEELYFTKFNHRKELWADTSFKPIYQNDVIIGVACCSRDITERKKSEEIAKINDARLIAAQRIAKIGSWEIDLITGEVARSAETFNIFEMQENCDSGVQPDIFKFVHPADRDMVKAAFINLMQSNEINVIEHRIITGNGCEKIIEERWKVSKNEAGQPIRVKGTCQDITERKTTESKLRKSEERYRSIIEKAHDAICIADSTFQIIDINPSGCTLLGYTREEFLKLTVNDLFLAEDLIENPFKFKELLTGKKASNERRFKRKDGSLIYGELNTTILTDGKFVVFCRDITERKKSEAALKAAYLEKNTILESIDDGFFAVDNNSLVTYWNRRAEILLGEKTEDVIGKNIHEMFTRPDFKIFYENYQKAIREKSTVHFEEFSHRTKKWFAVSAFASDNGLSVHFKDVTERKEFEEKIRESELRYNLVSQATNDMVWDWDLITNKVYRNPEGWKKILRIKDINIENGLIDDWNERIHPDDKKKVLAIIAQIKNSDKEFFEVECRVRRNDDTYAYIHDRGNIIRNAEGKAVRLIGATQDITQRKEAEFQVIKSETHFRSLVQNSSDLTGILDERGYFLYASPPIKRILGYDSESMHGKNAFSFVHPDDVNLLKNHLEKIHTEPEDKLRFVSFRFKNSDNEWRWLESKVTNMSNNAEVRGYIFNARDVTERKIAEAEIERLSIIARETENAVYISDVDGNITWVNEAFTSITEFEPHEVIGKNPWEFLHGEETNPAMERIIRCKRKQLKAFECDIINYAKSGRKYWVRIQTQPLFNDEGKLKNYFTIKTDITKEKEAEEILIKSEERYRYLFNNNPACIMIWDLKSYKILEVNDSAIALYGYNRKEFLTKTIFDLRKKEHFEQIEQFAQKIRSLPQHHSVKVWNHIDSNGNEMFMEITSHRIEYKNRLVVLALANNITEKVKLENELENERLLKQQEITQAVISAQELERQELGGELHDNINQILAGSRLYLGLATKELKIKHAYLSEADSLINTAILEIRKLSHSLIPPSLNDSELMGAIANIVKVTQQTAGIKIAVQAMGFDESKTDDKLKLGIYRIIQEQFNNIVKHANAQNVTLKLFQIANKTVLSIKDDGIGFDTTEKAKGVGLINIKTRVSLFNGSLSIISSPGKGCELRVIFNC